ncbi:hypothetical protein DPMN_185030 [Dreissena polymorpha]|uniref:Uncharacterized protein n=1 Tax=Dreissena polymorpha TaxID=45954 RepID=A0A9D4I6Y8_DREPO|nr:hypothetical protein DPMN_185030 [Dreissena polymorpha]
MCKHKVLFYSTCQNPCLHDSLFFTQVLELSANIYKQIPENIDYDNTVKILSIDPSPINVVLLQR